MTCDFPGPSVFAKRARGLMCRYIIESELKDADGLKDFCGYDDDCYAFSSALVYAFSLHAPTSMMFASRVRINVV